MTVYEPIEIGDTVTDDPKTNHCGKVMVIKPSSRPDYDDGDEAFVRWHKGYSNWIKIHKLEKWQEK